MSEWKTYKIKEFAEVVGGGTPNTTISEYWNGNISWITPRDLTGYRKTYISSGERKITEVGLKNSSSKLLPRGSVLITSRAPIGYVAIAEQEVCTNQGFKSLIINEKIANNLFIYYWVVNNTDFLNQMGTGTTFAEISGSVVKEIEIVLPPHEEQKAIASVLSSLDDKIDLLNRQNETLEKMAETLFRKWFVEDAKEDWEEKSLGELLTITSSKRIYYSEYVASGIPFYRSKEIIELRNSGSTSSELFISNERFNEIDSKFGSPKEGDILMTSVGTLGVAYRVKANEKFYFKDGNLTWFKDFKGLPSSVIYLWLISKIGQEELSSISIGSTQQALTIEGLKSICFKIPPKEIVSICEKQFDDIISKIDSNQNQILTLNTLRDTLLPKLMSGEVRVKLD